MKIKKRGDLVFVFLLFSILLVTMSSINADITYPQDNSGITGATVYLNASNLSTGYMINCTFWAFSPSTGNSTWTSLGTATNTTTNSANISTTFNSSTLDDSNDYTFNASCRNSSHTAQTVTKTGITVNNGVPDAPTSLVPTSPNLTTTTGAVTFTSTVSDRKTTGCTYTIYRDNSALDTGSSSGTATYSSTTCSFTKTFSNTVDNGNYYWTITASDGSNTTASATNIVQVQLPAVGGSLDVANGGGTTNPAPTTPANNSKTLIIIVVIVIIVFFVMSKKK